MRRVGDGAEVRPTPVEPVAGVGQPPPRPHPAPWPTLIGYWNRQAHNVTANDAHVDHFGVTPADLHGHHISELLGPSAYVLARPHVDAVLEGAEQSFTPKLVERFGVARYVLESFVPDVVGGEVRGFYHQLTDVTARIEAERARDEAVRLHQISMINAPIGKAILDTACRVVQVNPAMCNLLGWTTDELVGTDFRRYVDPDDLESGEADFAALLDGSVQQVASERRYVRRDGSTVWMQRNAVLVTGAHGAADVVIAQFQDVSDRRRAEAELARLAVTDPLTGLRNRYALVDFGDSRRVEGPEAPLGVVFIDLDGFKRINDAHGHAAGDVVLVQAAERLAHLLGRTATAYRLGGDEFVVLDPDTSTSTHTAELAERIRLALTGIHRINGVTVVLTASVGWAWGPTRNLEDLIRAADANMYRQKRRQGRRRSDPITGTPSEFRHSSFG